MVELRTTLSVLAFPALLATAHAQSPIDGTDLIKRPQTGRAAPLLGTAGPVARQLNRKAGGVAVPVPRPPTESRESPEPPVEAEGNTTRTVEPPYTVASRCVIPAARLEVIPQPAADDARCKVASPVRLLAVESRSPMALSGSPVLACDFAGPLVTFLTDIVQPLALYHLEVPVAELQTGPGFTCRNRNNAAQGKLSEHAYGNALDIAGFALADGRTISVGKSRDESPATARFLASVRTAACGLFTTVLGPGSDASHQNHLHLDRGRIAPDKRPYLLCD